jgi:hypothetical protein
MGGRREKGNATNKKTRAIYPIFYAVLLLP